MLIPTQRRFLLQAMFGIVAIAGGFPAKVFAEDTKPAPKQDRSTVFTECEQFRVKDEVTIAGGTEKIAFRAFPTIANLGNGELLVAYYLGRDHHQTSPAGVMTTRSLDAGRTWGEPFPLYAIPGYNTTGNLGLMKYPDGSLALKSARYYRSGWRDYKNPRTRGPERGPRHFEQFIVRSWDKGYFWTPPEDFGKSFKMFPGKYTSMHTTGDNGPYELSDGRWMTSLQGMLTDDGHWVAGVVFSADKGATWSAPKIIHDYHPMGASTEQRIFKLGPRRYLSYTRVDPTGRGEAGLATSVKQWTYETSVTRFSLSEDDGKTWSEPWKGNFMGSGAPQIVKLRDASLLCFYRDMDDQRAGLGVSHSADEGRNWQYLGRLRGPSDTKQGRYWELGYPVTTRLPDETILLVFYGPATKDGNANIVGLFLEDKTQ